MESPRQKLIKDTLDVFKKKYKKDPPNELYSFRTLWKWISKEYGIEIPKKNRSVYCNHMLKYFIESKGTMKGFSVKEHWLYPQQEAVEKLKYIL